MAKILGIKLREDEETYQLQNRLKTFFKKQGLVGYGREDCDRDTIEPSIYSVESEGEGGFTILYKTQEYNEMGKVTAVLNPIGATGSLVQRVFSAAKEEFGQENCRETRVERK